MNISEKITNALEKTGKFVKSHKATIISIVGPSILALIAKECGVLTWILPRNLHLRQRNRREAC